MWCTRECHVVSSGKDLWPIEFTWEMCKPQWASNCTFGARKPSHTSNHVYANNSFKFHECPSVEIDRWMWVQRPFLYQHQKTFRFYENKHLWCLCKILYWRDNYRLKSTPSHQLPTQRKHGHFPLWHIFKHSNHLKIAWLMCLCVDIHVGLMFIVIWIVDEWVRWT